MSYLIRTSEIKIENLDDYYKYVELHKTIIIIYLGLI